jgi:AmmeMemoRadiSam system protein B
VAALRAAGGQPACDDFCHRGEHSVEFQVLFIRHLFGDQVPVVPVLCGSVAEGLAQASQPGDLTALAGFARALADIVEPDSLVVAGVDLSHVGPKFGHPLAAFDYELKFRAHDQALLAAIEAGSAEQLWREARRVEDRYHVCGLPALALLLTALPGLRGELRGYHVWHEGPTRSAVSYAAALLFDRK